MVTSVIELLPGIGPFSLLWDIGLIIIVATLFNFIARGLKQPPLVAYILAGFFVYSGVPFLSELFFGTQVQLFAGATGANPLQTIRTFSELGVAFLLFSIGIETDLRKLKKLSSVVIIGGVLQVFFTAGFVFFLMTFFRALTFAESLYLSFILSFSSTMVVVKLLSDSFSVDTMHGRLMIGFLLVQDVLIVILLPIVGNWNHLFQAGFFRWLVFSGAALILLALFLSRFVYPWVFKFSVKNSELLYLSALSACFGFILISHFFLNIPIGIGGFVAGLSLSMLPYNFQIYDEIRGIRDFFVTIFLVTIGLQLSFSFMGSLWKMVLFALGVVFILKPLIFYLISYLSGHGKRISLFVALGLAQVSEFSFILASQGLAQGMFGEEFYSATIFIIALSMVVTPYVFKYSSQFYRFFNRFSFIFPESFREKKFSHRVSWLEEGERMSDHIVIVGAGVVGGSIARALNGKYPLVVMDHNPDIVEKLKNEKINIFLGEADNKLIRKKLHIKKSRLLVLAIPQVDASLKLLNYAKEVNPDIVVFARAHSFKDAAKLYEAGAEFVCMPEVVGSNVYLKTIMEYLETNALYHINVLHDEIISYLKERSSEEKKRPMRRTPKWV